MPMFLSGIASNNKNHPTEVDQNGRAFVRTIVNATSHVLQNHAKTMQKPFEWEHDDESRFTTHVSFVTDHGCRDTLLANLRPAKQDIQAWRIMEQCSSISYCEF